MRPLSGRKLLAILDRHGFVVVRQRGSHVILKHSDGRIVIVPLHGKKNQSTSAPSW